MTDFDLESLIHVEQSFYDVGYTDGFAHGRVHGLIEGRALGREKGFEIWEELGFYEGFARTWQAILVKQARGDERASQHIRQILSSIAQFPRVNPSSSSTSSPASTEDSDPTETTAETAESAADPDIDITKLLRQIRSRYKVLCAALGVRPRLRAVADAEDASGGGGADVDTGVDEEMNGVGQADVGAQRVAPGSAIPVWKLDSAGAKKPVTNQDLSF